MMEFGVSRPLHKTKKRVKQQEISRARKPSKTYRKQCCFNGCYKKHCKTQHVHCFWLPDPSPDHEKPKKNNGFSMVTIKNHCKTQCFCTFCSPKSLSRPSPKQKKLFRLIVQVNCMKKLDSLQEQTTKPVNN